MRALGLYFFLLAITTGISMALAEPFRPKSLLGWLLVVPVLVVCYLAGEAVSEHLAFPVRDDANPVFSWKRIAVGLALLIPFVAVPTLAVWLLRAFT